MNISLDFQFNFNWLLGTKTMPPLIQFIWSPSVQWKFYCWLHVQFNHQFLWFLSAIIFLMSLIIFLWIPIMVAFHSLPIFPLVSYWIESKVPLISITIQLSSYGHIPFNTNISFDFLLNWIKGSFDFHQQLNFSH